MGPKANNGDFIENSYNDFNQISLKYGHHFQNKISQVVSSGK
jgi:hypothetical protein